MIIRIRRRHKREFTIVPNQLWHDETLSLEAKGLQAFLLSLPDDWEVNIKHLQGWAKVGREKMRRLVKELSTAGWLKRHFTRDEKEGTFKGSTYIVLDLPDDTTDSHRTTENPSFGHRKPRKPAPGNPSLNKKKELNKESPQTPLGERVGEILMISPDTHPEQWTAWASHYECEKDKAKVRLMKRTAKGEFRSNSFAVPSEWPSVNKKTAA